MAVRMPRPQLCVRLSGNLDRVPLLRRFGSAVLTCEAKSEKKDKPEQEVTEITERLEFSHAESSVPSVTSCSILLCAFGSALLFPVADEVLLDRLRARLSKPNRGTQGRSPSVFRRATAKLSGVENRSWLAGHLWQNGIWPHRDGRDRLWRRGWK